MFKWFTTWLLIWNVLNASGVETFDFDKHYKIGVLNAPPFAMKDFNNEWDGLEVKLWENIAKAHNIKFEYVEYTNHTHALNAIKNNSVSMIIGGLNITADREVYGNFSLPFYTSTMSAGTLEKHSSPVDNLMDYLTSDEAKIYTAMLILLIILYSVFLYFYEGKLNSKPNKDLYEATKHPIHNFGNSLIWGLLLATATEGDVFKNKTLLGRFSAALLFFIGVLTFSTFIAILTSSLTVSKIDSMNYNDLNINQIKVGVTKSGKSEEYCRNNLIKVETFKDLKTGLKELQENKLDAVIGQKIEIEYTASMMKIPMTFATLPYQQSYYSFFFSKEFKHLNFFNDAMFKAMETPQYIEMLRKYTY